jgi:hypothetical protein
MGTGSGGALALGRQRGQQLMLVGGRQRQSKPPTAEKMAGGLVTARYVHM